MKWFRVRRMDDEACERMRMSIEKVRRDMCLVVRERDEFAAELAEIRGHTDRILERTPQLTREKLVERFGLMSETSPFWVALIHVIRGLEELAVENVAARGITDQVRAHTAGGIECLHELQEILAELLAAGAKAKSGESAGKKTD